MKKSIRNFFYRTVLYFLFYGNEHKSVLTKLNVTGMIILLNIATTILYGLLSKKAKTSYCFKTILD